MGGQFLICLHLLVAVVSKMAVYCGNRVSKKAAAKLRQGLVCPTKQSLAIASEFGFSLHTIWMFKYDKDKKRSLPIQPNNIIKLAFKLT
jgi:hypothetical protein